MAYSIDWLVPEHVIRITITETTTPEEVEKFSAEIYELMIGQKSRHMVHLFVDSREANLAASIHKYASAIKSPNAPNLGWIIAVGNAKLVALLSSILAKITRASFTYFTSMKDAVKFLRERDTIVDTYLNEHPDATIA